MRLERWQHEKIISNAQKAASRYRRRVWWADVEEMRQEAIKEQLVASRTLDLEGRTNPKDYFGAAMYRIAAISIKTMLCKASAPVSTCHRVDNLKGLTRATVMIMGADGGEFDRPELTVYSDPEQQVQAAESARIVRDRVIQVLGEDGAEFALVMLTGEFHPRDIVEAHGVEPETVYATIRQIKDMLSGDSTLFEMWRQT